FWRLASLRLTREPPYIAHRAASFAWSGDRKMNFFQVGDLFLTLYADFSIDARALFRHFYIWTSKRIEVRNITAITCD
ncbi:TPA: hypothetical protein MIY05_25385, partial [Klebsiella pneumoniae]|nr:hypothetical protein [Klebsiella pneumoniae]